MKVRSIRQTLLIWLMLGVATAILFTALLVYYQARNEANALSDNQMMQLVASLPQSFGPTPAIRNSVSDASDNFVLQLWDLNGLRIYVSHRGLYLPPPSEWGFYDLQYANTQWRIYNARLGNTIVQVAQPERLRSAAAAKVALRTVSPLLLLLPLLSVLIWTIVGKSLGAVRELATHVEARDVNSVSDIPDEELPHEIQPLTRAFNDLLARQRELIAAQGAFIADAAHELKTPLTALRLQVQLAERARDDADRSAAFADVKAGLERASHLVQQLLTMARQDPRAWQLKREPLDLRALAQSAVGDFFAIAGEKSIDLGVQANEHVDVIGDVNALRILLNNLLDNAIRYTPSGGTVDVIVESSAGRAVLIVRDTGLGIPEDEMSRVLDRFYRVPGTPSAGSGLGLAIVKQIADAHHATLEISNLTPGLQVKIQFPVSA